MGWRDGGNPVNLSDFSGLQSLGGFYDGYQLGQEYQSLYLNEQHNHLDAARHSEWNKAMVENCAPGIPWIMGRLNEARGYMDIPKLGFHKNIPAARYMDLHNNREGRRAGLENRPINVKNLILWAANTPESAKKNRERFKCDCDDTQFFTTKLRGPQQDKFTNFGDPDISSECRSIKIIARTNNEIPVYAENYRVGTEQSASSFEVRKKNNVTNIDSIFTTMGEKGETCPQQLDRHRSRKTAMEKRLAEE